MAWIELHNDVFTNKKLKPLSDDLHVDKMLSAAYLIRFWTWAIDNVEDVTGEITHLSEDDIATAAGWRKSPDKLVSALIKARWFDKIGDRLFIHDWEEYAGKLIKRRIYDRGRKKRGYSPSIPSDNPPEVPSNSVGVPQENGGNSSDIPSVYRTLTVPKEIYKESDEGNGELTNLQKVIGHYEGTVSLPSRGVIDEIKQFLSDGLSADEIIMAIDEVKANKADPSWPLIARHIDQWKRNGWHVIDHSSAAYRLAAEDMSELLEVKKTEPELQAWARVFDGMISEGKKAADICETMEWAITGGGESNWWVEHKAIQSAEALRKNYDKIRVSMGEDE